MSEMSSKKSVLIMMGSKSDFDFLKPAVDVLRELEIPFEIRVASAHRTPAKVAGLVEAAGKNNTGVIIAVAGAAAHLAGVIAGHTLLPVLGVPVAVTPLGGMDALLSMVQMPKGVPVGVMSLGGAVNAVLFAARILSVSDKNLHVRLKEWSDKMRDKVEEGDRQVQELLGE